MKKYILLLPLLALLSCEKPEPEVPDPSVEVNPALVTLSYNFANTETCTVGAIAKYDGSYTYNIAPDYVVIKYKPAGMYWEDTKYVYYEPRIMSACAKVHFKDEPRNYFYFGVKLVFKAEVDNFSDGRISVEMSDGICEFESNVSGYPDKVFNFERITLDVDSYGNLTFCIRPYDSHEPYVLMDKTVKKQ